jgi:predicted nucleic acid-binding protein
LIALDTNILVYAINATPDQRHQQASALIRRAVDAAWLLPVQVMAEFLNVTSRKRRDLQAPALAAVAALELGCTLVPTEASDATTAFTLATRHRLQYFDALVLTVAARAGATTLYSEDMQDGFAAAGLQIVNPFRPSFPVL